MEKNNVLASEIITDLLSTIAEVTPNLVALEGEALNLARRIDEEVKKLDSAIKGGVVNW